MAYMCKGCGKVFRTKKECKEHIKREHFDEINRSAGLLSFKYKCVKV